MKHLFIVLCLMSVCTICHAKRYSNYSHRYKSNYNYFPSRSYSNIYGGSDYYDLNGNRIRSYPNASGGFNYYRYSLPPR